MSWTVTTAGATAGISVACPCAIKFSGNVPTVSIEASKTDAAYEPIGKTMVNRGWIEVSLQGTFFIRLNSSNVTDQTNFTASIHEYT